MAAATSAPSWQPRLAGFWIRTIAYLIDALLLSLVGGAFPYLLIAGANPNQQTNGAVNGAGGSVALAVVYFIVFWSIGGGRTIGMRLLGLRVVRDDGARLGVLDAIVRVIGLWLSFTVCFVGVIWVAVDSRHQGWHDKLAHTLVVRV